MKPTKADRNTGEELRVHICQSPEPCLCHEEIIARHMAPERKRARREREVRKRLQTLLSRHQWNACTCVVSTGKETPKHRERCPIGEALAAAEALDKEPNNGL